MKFSKNEIQKIVLAIMGFLFVLYAYFQFLLNPMIDSAERSSLDLAKLTPKMEEAKKQFKNTQAAAYEVPEKKKLVDALRAGLPERSPLSWFPGKITEHLSRLGVENIDKVKIRQQTGDSRLYFDMFHQCIWNIDVPYITYAQFGKFIEGIDNDELLLTVSRITFTINSDNPEAHHLVLELTSLVKPL